MKSTKNLTEIDLHLRTVRNYMFEGEVDWEASFTLDGERHTCVSSYKWRAIKRAKKKAKKLLEVKRKQVTETIKVYV